MYEFLDEATLENLGSFLDNFDIAIAELEKTGATLLILGYSNFYFGADLDITETITNKDTYFSPDKVTLFGQELVLTGYICLFIVAMKRYWEKHLRNQSMEINNNLVPYATIANSYFLSVIANSIRLEGFYAIYLLRVPEEIE